MLLQRIGLHCDDLYERKREWHEATSHKALVVRRCVELIRLIMLKACLLPTSHFSHDPTRTLPLPSVQNPLI